MVPMDHWIGEHWNPRRPFNFAPTYPQ